MGSKLGGECKTLKNLPCLRVYAVVARCSQVVEQQAKDLGKLIQQARLDGVRRFGPLYPFVEPVDFGRCHHAAEQQARRTTGKRHSAKRQN